MIVLGFPEYQQQARKLAEALGVPYAHVIVHRFPDGESKITLPADLPEQVIFCRSLNNPNDKLVELILASVTARQLGAVTAMLVAPYMCYLRQDTRFRAGECVSDRIIGHMLADLFDEVVTVDPHLHRTHQLSEAIPADKAVAVSAATLMSEFLTHRTQQPVLLGPDEESQQWVENIARQNNLEWAVASKERLGDEAVRIQLPDRDFSDQIVVLMDDMISTGHTAAQTARLLLQAGAREVNCLVTHALFVGDAVLRLRDAGVRHIWSTDSVNHPSNVIELAHLLANTVLNMDSSH
jgi:ribose-phosphate pyrophosphokinase